MWRGVNCFPTSNTGKADISNTRAENLRRPTRRRERQMQRFKSTRQVQHFLSAHALIRGRLAAAPYTIGYNEQVPAPSSRAGQGPGRKLMVDLPKWQLGRTGLQVTMLGYGAMELRGAPRARPTTDQQAETILNAALDAGINYIDTSIDRTL